MLVYAAPVSANGTMLNRFDLNKEINKEATGGTNILTLYDPNKNNEAYSYSFRYNSASEDLNGNGDNAYIWAAVTVLNYDATQGRINSLGTAQAGNVRLSNTRGDGTELKIHCLMNRTAVILMRLIILFIITVCSSVKVFWLPQ